jgi:predicted MFS family arabinose efflux permease
VSSASSAPAGPSAAAIAAICGAEVLGLAGYSTVPAVLPQFIEAWSLTNTQAGWLAGIVSAGYMLAVVPLVSLTDRQPARLIYLASSMLSALSCFGVALCDSLLPALGFRGLAGIALAGMYMPGLQALTHGVEGTRRARIAAWYTSSFTIGASLSFLLGRVGTLLGWRSAFVLAGILSTAAVLIAWAALPRADPGFRKEPKSLLDLRPVFANRDALVLIFGYAAVIWGSAGLRQWIVVFLAFCAADQAGVPAQAWTMLAVGALISFLGVPAGLLGNELSIRYGLRPIATLVFLLSALTGGPFGFAAVLPYNCRLMPVRSRRLHRAGEFFQSHLGCPRRRRPAAQRSHDRGVFLRRLWRRVPRNTSLRRHTRSIRRDSAARRLDNELRHLWVRLFGRHCRHDFPVTRHLATASVEARLERKLRL